MLFAETKFDFDVGVLVGLVFLAVLVLNVGRMAAALGRIANVLEAKILCDAKALEDDHLKGMVAKYVQHKTPPVAPAGRDWRQEQEQLDEEAEYQAEVQESLNQQIKAFIGASPEDVATALEQLKAQEVTSAAMRQDWPAPLTVCHRPMNYRKRPWETGRCDTNCDTENALRLMREYQASGYDVKVMDARGRDITHLLGTVGPWNVLCREAKNDLWFSEVCNTVVASPAAVVAAANDYAAMGRYVWIVDNIGNNVTEAFVLQERGSIPSHEESTPCTGS